jgi:hypothetical protein
MDPDTDNSLTQSYYDLLAENAQLKSRLKEIQDHLAERIRIAEMRPPLSIGKPCPKCGQTVS